MKKYSIIASLVTMFLSAALPVAADHTGLSSAVSAEARVWIQSPVDMQEVSSPIVVVFGSESVSISPAGVERENSGHHHLMVDLDKLPAMDMPLPGSAQLIHFGKGQTETLLELEPGLHSLQLLLGNHIHVPHSRPVMSEKITILVK
ncbi:MAG: DUF4399 domain-containing protein [Porticoccaceae bacterium]|nr:DUF4399 domain-containing protein [Porticoccaceae bacterium]